jgi:hypothetical protein
MSIEPYTIIYKDKKGRSITESVDELGGITYTANFDLDNEMYKWGMEENWDPHTFVDADECQDNGYIMISEWIENEEFEEVRETA